MENSVIIFKNIVFQLRNLYIEKKGIDIEEFEKINDFSILKLIKLHFFIIAINSENDDYLLKQNEFWALPYGPVETTIYNQIRNNKNFNEFILSNDKIKFIGEKPVIDSFIEIKINEAIRLLLELEPRLIYSDAGKLVELTHKWNCWRKNYSLARAKNTYSSIIPNDDIINDMKVVNLDLV